MKPLTPIFGLLAEFGKPEEIVAATRLAREAGYRDMDAYTPYPGEGLAGALGLGRTRVPLIVLVGGIVGAIAGYGMQYWMMAVDYPLNVGGKPLNSWPAFLPVTFEVAILFAGLSALFGMLLLNGLPRPYHPIFNVPRFIEASQERFFLGIEATDPRFDGAQTRAFLEGLSPARILEIPHYDDALAVATAAREAEP
jgi:hypothetical protein